jgi:hypothetical protein
MPPALAPEASNSCWRTRRADRRLVSAEPRWQTLVDGRALASPRAMSRPLSFLPHLRAAWRQEVRHLSDRLHRVSARLGTAAERDEDFTIARQVADRLRTLQLALVGLSALTTRSGRSRQQPLRRRPEVEKAPAETEESSRLAEHMA